MKFYKEHEAAILKSFVKNGMTKDDFHFIKRKGRIITQHRSTKQSFSYYLKKDISFNEKTGDFEDASYFEVKHNNDKIFQIPTWKKVMGELNKWLKQLPSPN